MAKTKLPILPGKIIAIVIGQSRSDVVDGNASPLKTTRSFPSYASHLPHFKHILENRQTVAGHSVTITIKAVPPENFLVEVVAEVENILALDTLPFKEALLNVGEKALFAQDVEPGFKEEFTFYCVANYSGAPKQFFRYGDRIVPLLKSENVELSTAEIEKTMHESSLQYAKDDLTIVDWDGAFIFDVQGDWKDTIDVLEVANVNLLRLRRLDQLIDTRLDAMVDILRRVPKISTKEVRKMMTELMRLRTQSVVEFEHAERDIQLIGDWYAGRLYTLASKKLHLDRWRQSIKQVLESLEDMSSVAADHFSVTNERRAEQVQQFLWYVQLIGWFVLLFLEWRVMR
jgi:hypothetical protein